MTFEECLNDCVDRLQRGEALEACLARYPQHADALRDLLEVGLALTAAPPPLSTAGRIRARQRMQTAAVQVEKKHRSSWPRRLALPLAAGVALVFLVVVMGAARTSGPGDAAYPLRQFAESAAVRLTADPVDRAARHLDRAERYFSAVQRRWEATQDVDFAGLDGLIAQLGEALEALAQATGDAGRAKPVLTELAAIAYEARQWALSAAAQEPVAPAGDLETVVERLSVYERWAQAGLLDPDALQGYLRGELPPVPPMGPTQTPVPVPSEPAATPTAVPVLIETEALPTPGQATTATRPASPTQPGGSPTPTRPAAASKTPTPLGSASPAVTSTAAPTSSPTATGRPDEPTATPRPATPTPTREVTLTITPRPATPTPRPATATATPVHTSTPTPRPTSAIPTETSRPATPTLTAQPPNTPTATWLPNTATATFEPTATEEPTETPRPTQTPRPSNTPKPTDTPEPTETEEPTETPRPTRTPEPTETPRPTETDDPSHTPKSPIVLGEASSPSRFSQVIGTSGSIMDEIRLIWKRSVR